METELTPEEVLARQKKAHQEYIKTVSGRADAGQVPKKKD